MLEAGTYSFLIMGPIGPGFVGAISSVMGLPHPFDRYIGRNAFRKVEAVIGRLKGARTGSFPFMGVADALAHGPADESGFAGAHPDNRVGAGDIGKLELIDTGPGILGRFGGRIIKRRHVLCPANSLKFAIFISDGQLAELFLSPLRGQWMLGYGRVSLADVAGFAKDCADGIHLLVGQSVDPLNLHE